jgi:lambda family phage tail tape measure protein
MEMMMDELNQITQEAEESAAITAQLFEDAGERISQALERAARSGEVSFDSMVESVLQSLARLIIEDAIVAPLSSAISSLGSSAVSAASGVTVNMNVSGVSDTAGFEKSKGQISASLARVVQSGQRYL